MIKQFITTLDWGLVGLWALVALFALLLIYICLCF